LCELVGPVAGSILKGAEISYAWPLDKVAVGFTGKRMRRITAHLASWRPVIIEKVETRSRHSISKPATCVFVVAVP
jgi:hypothetical protein